MTGVLIVIGVALVLHAPLLAQRGGGAPRPPIYPTKQQFEASGDAQKHVDAAKALAGRDLQTEFENTCSYPGPERAALRRERLGLPPIKDYTSEPTKIFDNVWFMGLASQGAFVITTTQGLILIDTLNTTDEARDILVPSMQKVGLDPAQIKYIVLTHGHPGQTDHTGGANYLQKTYHPRVMMAKEDWDATLPAQKPERPLAQRDIDIKHGDKLTLGDETLTFTPLRPHAGNTRHFHSRQMARPAARRSAARRRTPAPESRLADPFRERDQGLRAEDGRGGDPQRPSRHLPGHARGPGNDSDEPDREQSAALWTRARHALLDNHG